MRISMWRYAAIGLLMVAGVAWLYAEQVVEPDATERGENGLELSIESAAGGRDWRASKQVALRVDAGESPSAMLAPGPFSASWQGMLTLEKRSRLYFSFEGVGEARLWVNGELVVEGIGKESERIRLNGGDHQVKVVYQSAADGSGRLRMMWRGRDFGLEPVPAKVLSYQPSEPLERSEELRHGRALFAEYHCGRCHEAAAGMPELVESGPSLAGVGSRLEREWLEQWLLDPAVMRAHARMPDVLDGPEQAADVATYLATLEAATAAAVPAQPAASQLPLGNAKVGEKVFIDLGCIACHQTSSKQAATAWAQPPVELYYVGHKFKREALVEFLRNPAAHHASTRMPDFGLSEGEARDVVAYLRGLAEPLPKPKGQQAGDVARGQKLVLESHCGQCHEGLAQQKGSFPSLAEMAGKSGCHEAQGKGPRYAMTARDQAALKAFMADQVARESTAHYHAAEYAQRQWKNLNCAACHGRDGVEAGLEQVRKLSGHEAEGGHAAGPPKLDHLGDKLKQDWLEELFAGQLGYRTRPWLKQRMPAFKSRAARLAAGFSAQAGVVDGPSGAAAEPAMIEVGKTLFGMQGGFGCAACHGAGEAGPLAVFEAPGVNLAYAGERLRADYYHRWMRDPRRIDPETIMPKYFTDDNMTTLAEPLDGDGGKQMEALLEWMHTLKKQPKNNKQ